MKAILIRDILAYGPDVSRATASMNEECTVNLGLSTRNNQKLPDPSKLFLVRMLNAPFRPGRPRPQSDYAVKGMQNNAALLPP